MRVAIVGAGPAGLYFARLLKRTDPGASVTIFEQGARGATWGFGVGLGGRTMREIEMADPAIHRAIADAMTFGSQQLIRLGSQDFILDYNEPLGAIERLTLLRILAAAAAESGVDIRYDQRRDDLDRLTDEHDLVVAADGINSSLRGQRADRFGTHVHELTNRFAWYGVARALRPMALVFRNLEQGAFIAHYYPYADGKSTFVAECDPQAWQRTGMDRMSNAERKSFVEKIFAPELQGQSLVDNHSIWRRFPVVTNDRYAAGNVVLLGDSLRSAHFSIGSGTRLAMEDAAALNQALTETGLRVAPALGRFEQIRRPGRDALGEAGRRSFEWYEQVADYMRLPLMDFIHAFLTRTGRVDDRRLQTYVPQFFRAYQQHRQAG